jgi:gas vesicle protein
MILGNGWNCIWPNIGDKQRCWSKISAPQATTKLRHLKEVIQRYVVAMEKVASGSHGHLAETEKAARQIKFELEHGVAESKQELEKIRNDIQDERIRLEKARRDMDARMTWQERFQIIFVLAGFVFLGFLIGRHLIR